MEAVLTPVNSLPEGTLILDGRFRIEGLLGGGGMGLVYAAVQVSLGRRVAVKVLRDDVPRAALEERFRREAQLLSSVDHPSVVRVIDFGPLGDSMCLVMEYVEGDTLEALLLREAPLSVDRAERIVTQLAQGLGAIHARGIVHRDLKPDNVVMTTSADGQVLARLLDFGIARLVEAPEGASVTQVGFVVGTPEYVSPEQAMGRVVDVRSDLYALGLIGFRMLVGRHPFAGPGAREFFAQHINEAVPRLVDLAPHLDAFPALVATVNACLAKDPLHRPQTAAELLEMLTRPPMQLLVEAPAPTPEKVNRRPLWVAAAVVGLVLATATGAAVGSYRAEPTRKARRLLTEQRGSEALQVIDELGEGAKAWRMQMLQAAALHQVGRHDDEFKVMEKVPPGETLEPLALEALADDFGHGEPARLRRLLASFQKADALPSLQELAGEDQRWAQWGALRFIDLEYAGQGLPLLELYSRALVNRDCGIRRVAVKRLAELRNPAAIVALEALSSSPRVKNEDCGHDAATQAVTRLQREVAE
jgi:predicted Ser/Thr protein kinase